MDQHYQYIDISHHQVTCKRQDENEERSDGERSDTETVPGEPPCNPLIAAPAPSAPPVETVAAPAIAETGASEPDETDSGKKRSLHAPSCHATMWH